MEKYGVVQDEKEKTAQKLQERRLTRDIKVEAEKEEKEGKEEKAHKNP